MATSDAIVEKLLACKWTNGGAEVLLLKCVPTDGIVRGTRAEWAKSQHGDTYEFYWPLTVGTSVEAPDWDPRADCGGGLHSWPWGLSMGDGMEPNWNGRWLVFGAAPEDIVDLGGKCKAHRGTIRFVGTWHEALMFVLPGQMAYVAAAAEAADAAASATGGRGAASATGWSGAASATGWRGAASATGDHSAAVVTGESGRARAGKYGCIALSWWNQKEQRAEMRCGETGSGDGSDGKLKANVWYRLDESGEFQESED